MASNGDGSDAADPCEATAQEIVDRLDRFLEPFSDLSPEEFLGQELDGLDDFQNDVGQIVVQSTQPGGGCAAQSLETALDNELKDHAGEGLLADFLVDAIRTGGQRSVRNLTATPDDDLPAILALLDTGSSVTLTEGTFELDATLFVPVGVTVRGAGAQSTLITSTAADAAMAVFGGASLAMSDLSITHTGSAPASVMLVFASSVDLDGVRLTGGVSGEEGIGGNGLLLTAADLDEAPGTTEADEADSAGAGETPASSVVVNSEISDNAAAGIAITSDLTPTFTNNIIARNDVCGICYFDTSGGSARGNTIEGNVIGIRTGDRSAPNISENELANSTLAAVVIDGTASPTVFNNVLEGNAEVAIDIQGAATPELRSNTIGAHPIAVSIRGSSQAVMHANTVRGADVALQVGGQAQPSVQDNEITETVLVGLLLGEDSAGTFANNVITGSEGAGLFVEGAATPALESNTIEGGEVGISFTESSGGSLNSSTLSGQDISVDVRDDAAPHIEGNTISDSTSAGVVFSSTIAGTFVDNSIIEPGAIGIQLVGSTEHVIEANRIEGGQTGASLLESSAALLIDNMFTGQDVGIDVGGSATPVLQGNTVSDAVGAGLVFREESAGEATDNTILNPAAIGIQLLDSAHPLLDSNAIDASAVAAVVTAELLDEDLRVGLLYAGDSAGTARENQLLGVVIGIQITESSMPTLESNFVDGGGLGGVGIIYVANAAGTATGNRTTGHLIGFQMGDDTTPIIEGNVVEAAEVAAFVLRGNAAGSLSGNECPTGIPGIALTEQAAPALGENNCAVVNG